MRSLCCSQQQGVSSCAPNVLAGSDQFLCLDSTGVWSEGRKENCSSAGSQRSETLLPAGRGKRGAGWDRCRSGEASGYVRVTTMDVIHFQSLISDK